MAPVEHCRKSGKRRFSSHLECLAQTSGPTYQCGFCGDWHLTRALKGEKAPDVIRAISRRSFVAGPREACYFCGGALEVRGCLCLICHGSGLRAAA